MGKRAVRYVAKRSGRRVSGVKGPRHPLSGRALSICPDCGRPWVGATVENAEFLFGKPRPKPGERPRFPRQVFVRMSSEEFFEVWGSFERRALKHVCDFDRQGVPVGKRRRRRVVRDRAYVNGGQAR